MFNLYTLDNGLRVVTEYIEHVNSISVGIMVQNGSRNESKDVNGISHFIEHMFFKGTEKRTAKTEKRTWKYQYQRHRRIQRGWREIRVLTRPV